MHGLYLGERSLLGILLALQAGCNWIRGFGYSSVPGLSSFLECPVFSGGATLFSSLGVTGKLCVYLVYRRLVPSGEGGVAAVPSGTLHYIHCRVVATLLPLLIQRDAVALWDTSS